MSISNSLLSTFSKDALNGQTVLVTGATSGIGASVSDHLYQYGANLVLIGRNKKSLAKAQNRYSSNRVITIEVDLLEPDIILEKVKSIKNEYLPFTGVFHAAGLELIRPVNYLKHHDLYQLSMPTIFSGLSIGTLISNKKYMADGGSCIFMSSVASVKGTVGLSAYAACKGAINSFSKSLAAEVSSRSVRVNTILPGAVETPMHQRIFSKIPKDTSNHYEKNHPLGFGTTDDIAGLVIFLLSPASRWITGSSILIDGGYMLSN